MFYTRFIKNKKIISSDLIPELEHFFTTRDTVIRGNGTSIQDLIAENKKNMCDALGIELCNLISPTQTHSANVEISQIKKSDYPDTDGLILDNKEQAVFLNFADCTPVILYDKEHNIGAISHAGWKGTVSQIGQKTAKIMMKKYGTKLENLYAIIGPSISECCYEVGDEVFNKLKASVKNIEGHYHIKNNKIYVDLKRINKEQLLDINIPEKNIDVCPYCTSCDNNLFFSYRKENGTTSRHSAVIRIK